MALRGKETEAGPAARAAVTSRTRGYTGGGREWADVALSCGHESRWRKPAPQPGDAIVCLRCGSGVVVVKR